MKRKIARTQTIATLTALLTLGISVAACDAEHSGRGEGPSARAGSDAATDCSQGEWKTTIPYLSNGNFTAPEGEVLGLVAGLSVRNTHGSATGKDRVVFHGPNGESVGTHGLTLVANQDEVVGVPDLGSETIMSATVCTANPVAVATNLGVRDQQGVRAWASYSAPASNTLDTESVLPLVQHNNGGFSSQIVVHNPGMQRISPVVTFDSGHLHNVGPLEPKATRVVSLESVPGLPNGARSAVVRAGRSVAATTLETNGEVLLASAGSPSAAGSTTPLFPLINQNNDGVITGLQIYNDGNRSSQISVRYQSAFDESTRRETQTIPAGASRTFGLTPFSDGRRFVGAARVEANSTNAPLFATVNQLGRDSVSAGAYRGMSADELTGTLLLPLIRNDGEISGVSVMNASPQTTTVTCVFAVDDHGRVQDDRLIVRELAPYHSFVALTDTLDDGYVGSGHCRSSNGAVLAGVVNSLTLRSGEDGMLVHEGVPNPHPDPLPENGGVPTPLQPNSASSECSLTTYEPDIWNESGGYFNCYSYAGNVFTDGIGHPGAGAGCTDCDHNITEQFYRGVELDGLTPSTQDARCPNNETKILSWHTWFGAGTWHFAREDRDGYWSEIESPGGSANRIGLDGFPMSTPPMGDVPFARYFCACSDEEQFEGKENITGVGG